MIRTRVGVLRGGTGSEADLSLKTGAALIASFPEDDYDVRDIFIDKAGVWYVRGAPMEPTRAIGQLDVAVNALHGGIGEDGTVSRILERSMVPFTGSNAFGAAQSLNKVTARRLAARAGIKVPRGVSFTLAPGTTVDVALLVREVFGAFSPPYILKPVNSGASHGVAIAKTYIELGELLAALLEEYTAVLVEEYVRGQEATVGIIEDFRGEPLYALPPALAHLPAGHTFMPSSAYRSGLELSIPAHDLSYEKKQLLMHFAKEAHKALSLEHYSRSDFIVSPHGIYLLEVNALPGLYEGAAIPTMLETVGSSVPELSRHLVGRELRVML